MLDSGYVYVLMNPSMQGLVKIGKTVREPIERAKELSSTTGVPTPFVVVYDCYFESCTKAESFIHSYLEAEGYRVSPSREFFEIPMKNAIDAVMKAKEHYGEFHKQSSDTLEEFEESFTNEDDENYDPDFDNLEIYELLQKADSYQYGLNDELQDVPAAINLYKQALKLGSITANRELGALYCDGTDIPQDIGKGMKYLLDGARTGDTFCYYLLAQKYLEQNNEENAYKSWKKFFTSFDVDESLLGLIGSNYLRFIATFPRKIEFIDILKPAVDEIIQTLYDMDMYNGLKNQDKLTA